MRKGIANFMNWESIDCEVAGTASDGMEAIAFLESHPVDIVITDIKMPEADGLYVARHVYEHYPDIRVILLTGYADFEYAQTAIRYNVVSFILKPTNKKDLFEAVQNAQKQLIVSKKQSSIAKEELAFLKEQMLQELTNQPFSEELAARMGQLEFRLDTYCTAAFQMQPGDSDIHFLKEIIIQEKKHAYCYRYNNLIIEIYFLDEGTDGVPDYVPDNCREISHIVQTLYSKEVAVGIGRQHVGGAQFRTAVSEAIYALSQTFYSEQNIARFTAFAEDQPECDLTAENSLDLFNFENCLNNWNFDGAAAVAHNIFTKFKANFVHAHDAKAVCSQMYYICSRVLMKRDCGSLASDLQASIRRSPDIFALEDAIQELIQLTRTRLLGTAAKQNKIVEHTMQYIHDHLADPLSLEALALKLHVSPAHLSRTFKKSCGESLTEYINKTRVLKAQEYLIQTSILTYEIAGMVGYNDPTYFSSIFKKYTGMSPTDFRQMH